LIFSNTTTIILIYDEEVSTTHFWRYAVNKKEQYAIGSGANIVEITDTGFSVSANMVQVTYSYLAVG
jgi:hypothetical protein